MSLFLFLSSSRERFRVQVDKVCIDRWKRFVSQREYQKSFHFVPRHYHSLQRFSPVPFISPFSTFCFISNAWYYNCIWKIIICLLLTFLMVLLSCLEAFHQVKTAGGFDPVLWHLVSYFFPADRILSLPIISTFNGFTEIIGRHRKYQEIFLMNKSRKFYKIQLAKFLW